jgi:hypothetical protein
MQQQAAAAGISEERRQYDVSREDYAPWRTTGSNALKLLEAKINAGPGEFTTSPGYESRLAEGQKAVERAASARTGVLGGESEKALLRYNQDYASNEYSNFLNQYYQSLTPLQSAAGLGLTATSGTTAAGSNATNVIAQLLQNSGQAQAAGILNQANATSGAIQSGMNNALSAYSAWKASGTPVQSSQPVGNSLTSYNTTQY